VAISWAVYSEIRCWGSTKGFAMPVCWSPGLFHIVSFRCGVWTGTSMGDAKLNRVITYAGILAMCSQWCSLMD
jgi:hypothetical protein